MSDRTYEVQTPEDPTQIFSETERAKVEEVFQNELSSALRPGERISVTGTYADERLVVRAEIADPSREDVAVFEAGHDQHDGAELTLVEARAHAVEFLHSVIRDYLQGGRWPRPHIDWKVYDFERRDVFLRGEVRNEALESLADEWLERGGPPEDA